jgi:DNA-binding FrmR family transcriptional regulator|tara:strand:- start:358 stop:504 length:147 start_codon:yes stop_codon:yes gene_type:complete
MKDSIKGVKGFEERLKRMEGKIESVNEKVENTSRTQKEHLTSTKDMLL